jgi:hypothetical protein
MMTSAECAPWLNASVQAASTADSPSLSTAVRISNHLPIAVGGGRQLAVHPLEARRQQPVLEGGAIAQGTWLAGQHRHIVPGIV